MIRNYYTLLKLVREFQSLLGLRLAECFSQDRNNIVLHFYDGINSHYLNFVHSSPNDTIFLSPKINRAKLNSSDIFDEVIGDTVQNIELIENQRIIRIDFINSKLYFFILGGKDSNLIALNNDNEVVDYLYRIENDDFFKYFHHQTTLYSDELSSESKSIKEILLNDYLFSRDFVKQICNQLNIDQNMLFLELNPEKQNEFQNLANNIKNQLLESNEYLLLLNKSKQYRFSFVELSGYEVHSNYTTISQAIQKRVVKSIVEVKFSSEFRQISDFLKRIKNKAEKTLSIYLDENEIFERINQYKTYAEVLISSENPYKKGLKLLKTVDWSANNIEIPLDNKFNLIENANRYFEKTKSASEELKVRRKRIPELQEKLNKVLVQIEQLNKIETNKELEKFRNNLKINTGHKMKEEVTPIDEKFRKFDLGNGYYLYVGKNAANNDELTMRFAKPNDLWMHARGSSGSHAVLKSPDTERIPKMVLQKAAEITAYYSGARNAKYTPVCYTLKKYVRKPKGANIGAVVITKEDVIMAEPKLPE